MSDDICNPDHTYVKNVWDAVVSTSRRFKSYCYDELAMESLLRFLRIRRWQSGGGEDSVGRMILAGAIIDGARVNRPPPRRFPEVVGLLQSWKKFRSFPLRYSL